MHGNSAGRTLCIWRVLYCIHRTSKPNPLTMPTRSTNIFHCASDNVNVNGKYYNYVGLLLDCYLSSNQMKTSIPINQINIFGQIVESNAAE